MAGREREWFWEAREEEIVAEREETTGNGSQAATLPVAMELGPVRLVRQTEEAQEEKVALEKRSSAEGWIGKLRSGRRWG